MAEPKRNLQQRRDERIKDTIKQVLGMSVPKYIAITYGRSQKAAQILFNQPERRRPQDEEMLAEIATLCKKEDRLAAHFIARILGSDPKVLNNIQTTIDSRFQSLEAQNTVISLARPMLSNVPEIRQLEMINDKYYHAAVEMQTQWLEAKKKQDEIKGKTSVHIPYTLEQIKTAFQVVIDMCLLIIDLKSSDESTPAREAIARAYALLSAAAIQIGRYDLVEIHAAQWRERFELINDKSIPLRVRNLLLQKELWLFKRKGDYPTGLAIARDQWERCTADGANPRWMDLEPLVCAGLELAALHYKAVQEETADEQTQTATRQEVAVWLERFTKAPDRAEELGSYLKTDPELEAVREHADQTSFVNTWSKLMKKFGVFVLLFFGLTLAGWHIAQPPADLPPTAVPTALEQAPALDATAFADETSTIEIAGANPGKLIWELILDLFGINAEKDWFC